MSLGCGIMEVPTGKRGSAMEHFNIDPITTGEELFRLLFPSILEQTPCSDTNAVIGLISDACYALLLYKAVPGAAPEARSAQEAALETFLHGHGIHCFRFHGHHMGIIPYHTWDLAVVPQKTEILEHRIGIYLSKALRDSGVELNLSIGRSLSGPAEPAGSLFGIDQLHHDLFSPPRSSGCIRI